MVGVIFIFAFIMSFVINFLEKKAGVNDDAISDEKAGAQAVSKRSGRKNYRVYKGSTATAKYLRVSHREQDPGNYPNAGIMNAQN